MREPVSQRRARSERGEALAKSSAVSWSGCAASKFGVPGWIFSMASWVSRNSVHICCLPWSAKSKSAAPRKLHMDAAMARGNRRRTT